MSDSLKQYRQQIWWEVEWSCPIFACDSGLTLVGVERFYTHTLIPKINRSLFYKTKNRRHSIHECHTTKLFDRAMAKTLQRA